MSDCTDITCVPGERTTSYICEVGCAPAAPLPPLQLSWSEAELTGDGQTADVLFGGGRLPLTLEVTYIGGPDLAIAFDRPTVTLSVVGVLAETTTATIRATLRDAAGQEAVADLPVSVEPIVATAQITVLNVYPEGDGPSPQIFMHSSAGPSGLQPTVGVPPFELIAPDFQDLFPAWNYSDPMVPEGVNYPDMYVVYAPGGVETLVIEVALRDLVGGESISWTVNDGSSAHVLLATFDSLAAENQPSITFTVTVDPGEIFGAARTGDIRVTADVNGTPYEASIQFGFTLAGF